MSPSPTTAKLALDCANASLSLALHTSAGKTHTISNPLARSSDALPLAVQSIFNGLEINVSQLTHIILTTGPGSFTGIRLGLATAEALKLLNNSLHIIGISSLQAYAAHIIHTSAPAAPFTVVLDAAGGQAYSQSFTPDGSTLTAPECLPTTTISTQFPLYAPPSLLLSAHPLPQLDAWYLFKLAENQANHLPPEPLYLKPLTYKKVAE